jgi:hypothetical protein
MRTILSFDPVWGSVKNPAQVQLRYILILYLYETLMKLKLMFTIRRFLQLVIVLLASTMFLGCQKNKDEDYSELKQRLQGKWNFINYVTNQYYGNSNHLSTVSASPGDYMEFQPEGKIYLVLFGSSDTSSYTIPANNKILIDYTDNFDIKTLTESELVLYSKQVYSGESYYEQTFTLHK